MANIVKVYTTKDAQNNLNELNFGLEILNEYKNHDTKLHIKCTTCGDEDYLTYSDIKRYGKRCSCNNYKKTIRWNLEKVKQFLLDNNRNIELVSQEYISYTNPLRFRCTECGYEWETTWGSVKSGNGCARCTNSLKLTKDDMFSRLEKYMIKHKYEIINKEDIFTTKDKFICKCSKGHVTTTSYASLSLGCGCIECRNIKLRNIIKERRIYAKEVKEELKTKGINIIILSEDNEYSTFRCKCPVCEHEFISTRSRLLSSGCAVCNINSLKIGYNDIGTTNPELVKYFVNKDEALVSKGSSNVANFKCPDCGTEKTQQIRNAFATGKYCCSGCSDGVSIPNKMLANILKQSGINFVTEKGFGGSNFRYDAYIEINGRKICVEAHGRQHYDKGFDFEESSNEKIKLNDMNKRAFVESIGVEYLEIDCKYSDFDYLKENFIKSLSNLIDISNVDFEKAYEISMSSKMIDACKLYKDKHLEVLDIAKELDVSDVTIRTYLKRGTLLGLCDYDGKLVTENSKHKVLMIDIKTNEILGEYESVNSAARETSSSAGNISRIINGLQGTTKDHTWIRKSDYKKE